MINFSKVGTKEELLEEISKLPESTHSASTEICAQAKATATLLVTGLKTSGGHVNLRANEINQWKQIECQVSGQEIKPKEQK